MEFETERDIAAKKEGENKELTVREEERKKEMKEGRRQ